jgi:hypothetical protein
MAQHDQNVANDTSANVRADINNALAALFSSSSGSSAPATTIAYQFWADTTNGLLKIRNATNSAWITLGAFDAAAFRFLPGAGSLTTPAFSTDADTNTGIDFPAADTVRVITGGTEACRFNSDEQTVHAVGSASLPSVTFTGDLNTGMYLIGADVIGITTGGVNRGRIDAGGVWCWNSNGAVYAGSRATFWAQAASQAAIEAVNSSTGGNAIIARVNDTSSNFAYFDYAGTLVGSITTNGSVTAYNTSSDARLKSAIVDLPDPGWVIDAIRPRVFNWIGNGQRDVGFVAQELATVVPGAVTVGSVGDLERDEQGVARGVWQVDASRLLPYVIGELQALRARLAAIEAR